MEVHRSIASPINKKHTLVDVTSEFEPSPFRFSLFRGRAVHVWLNGINSILQCYIPLVTTLLVPTSSSKSLQSIFGIPH
jgi:hypothetical protein